MRATVRMLESGKVTIPKPIRDELALEEGDVVSVDVWTPADRGGLDDNPE